MVLVVDWDAVFKDASCRHFPGTQPATTQNDAGANTQQGICIHKIVSKDILAYEQPSSVVASVRTAYTCVYVCLRIWPGMPQRTESAF